MEAPTTYYALETMKTIRFGVEVELSGEGMASGGVAPLQDARKVIAAALGGTRKGCDVAAPDGRIWQIEYDASIEDCYGFELITPICTYEDIPTVQRVVTALARAGAREDELCGVHVHIDGARFTTKQVGNLVKLCYQQEELILAALGGQALARVHDGKYCNPTAEAFIRRLVSARALPTSHHDLRKAWYPDNPEKRPSQKYDDSRYTGVNLHSLFYQGTIEFRWFPTTTSASRLKTYIQLCLALGARALNARATRASKREEHSGTSERFAMRSLLVRLGLNGPEFRALRRHLLDGLQGDISYARPLGNDNHRRAAVAP